MLTILIQVNVLGSVYPTRAVLAGMKKKKAGRIVFVASQVAQVHFNIKLLLYLHGDNRCDILSFIVVCQCRAIS